MVRSDFYKRLLEALEAQKRDCSVYALVNHTKKMIYFGVSKNRISRYL
jgi:hypothetical protein